MQFFFFFFFFFFACSVASAWGYELTWTHPDTEATLRKNRNFAASDTSAVCKDLWFMMAHICLHCSSQHNPNLLPPTHPEKNSVNSKVFEEKLTLVVKLGPRASLIRRLCNFCTHHYWMDTPVLALPSDGQRRQEFADHSGHIRHEVLSLLGTIGSQHDCLHSCRYLPSTGLWRHTCVSDQTSIGHRFEGERGGLGLLRVLRHLQELVHHWGDGHCTDIQASGTQSGQRARSSVRVELDLLSCRRNNWNARLHGLLRHFMACWGGDQLRRNWDSVHDNSICSDAVQSDDGNNRKRIGTGEDPIRTNTASNQETVTRLMKKKKNHACWTPTVNVKR